LPPATIAVADRGFEHTRPTQAECTTVYDLRQRQRERIVGSDEETTVAPVELDLAGTADLQQ